MLTNQCPQPASLALNGLVERVRAEYVEMPGLALTVTQAQRLWGLDRGQCDCIFRDLVDAGFLRRTKHGYIRHGETD